MKKVMVIDEDALVAQEVLQAALMGAGYQTYMAGNAAVGLDVVNEFKPDLVILDPWIPFGLGFVLAHGLREASPELPVIFVTAGMEDWVREMAEGMGAVGVIEKPYAPEKLLASVKDVFDRMASPRYVSDTQTPLSSALDETVLASREKAAADAHHAGSALHFEGRHRILIVEDDRKIAMALAVRLQHAGQEVLVAYDALTGLASAIENQPDLVLMDIGLPGGSGLVVAERIQSLCTKRTPVIFLTASRQQGLRDKALALGAAGFLEKPYDSRELLVIMQHALYPMAETVSVAVH